MNDDVFDPLARTIGDDYEVLPDGRVPVYVMTLLGEEAWTVTPWHGYQDPMVLSAAAIARDCGLPNADEVLGREFTAAGDAAGLSDFRLVYDPRD